MITISVITLSGFHCIFILQGEEWILCESKDCPLMKYHDHAELLSDLDLIENSYPENAKQFSLGFSINNLELKGIRLSNGVRYYSENLTIDMRPMVKFIGNINGNEPTGRELIIQVKILSKKLIF